MSWSAGPNWKLFLIWNKSIGCVFTNDWFVVATLWSRLKLKSSLAKIREALKSSIGNWDSNIRFCLGSIVLGLKTQQSTFSERLQWNSLTHPPNALTGRSAFGAAKIQRKRHIFFSRLLFWDLIGAKYEFPNSHPTFQSSLNDCLASGEQPQPYYEQLQKWSGSQLGAFISIL